MWLQDYSLPGSLHCPTHPKIYNTCLGVRCDRIPHPAPKLNNSPASLTFIAAGRVEYRDNRPGTQPAAATARSEPPNRHLDVVRTKTIASPITLPKLFKHFFSLWAKFRAKKTPLNIRCPTGFPSVWLFRGRHLVMTFHEIVMRKIRSYHTNNLVLDHLSFSH